MDNELITIKESFYVVMDSRNATNIKNPPFNSDVDFQFEGSLYFNHDDYIQLTFSVNSFSCANSIYVINETNNKLSITMNDITNIYLVTYGNYNINTFQSYLLSILPNTFNLTYKTTNNIYTLTNTTYDFIINSTSTINEVMGFSKNTNYYSINKSFTFPYTSNFIGLQNINIAVDNINTNNLDSFTKSQSSIIQSIPIDVLNPVIKYVKTNDVMIPIKVNFIDSLNINILDDQNNFINLNNQHFNLTIQFTIIKNIPRYKNNFTNILNEN